MSDYETRVIRCRHCGEITATANYWSTCDDCLTDEYLSGDGRTIRDENQTLSLGNDDEIHTLIDDSGDVTYWFIDGSDPNATCRGREIPAHEMAGPLPVAVRAKIARAHCGRMTRSGKPCKNLATCRHHKKK